MKEVLLWEVIAFAVLLGFIMGWLAMAIVQHG